MTWHRPWIIGLHFVRNSIDFRIYYIQKSMVIVIYFVNYLYSVNVYQIDRLKLQIYNKTFKK